MIRDITPRCSVQWVQWYMPLRPTCSCDGGASTHVSTVRRIALPSGAVAHVIDDPSMPADVMQRVASQIGAHPALSWLASHSRTMRGTHPPWCRGHNADR